MQVSRQRGPLDLLVAPPGLLTHHARTQPRNLPADLQNSMAINQHYWTAAGTPLSTSLPRSSQSTSSTGWRTDSLRDWPTSPAGTRKSGATSHGSPRAPSTRPPSSSLLATNCRSSGSRHGRPTSAPRRSATARTRSSATASRPQMRTWMGGDVVRSPGFAALADASRSRRSGLTVAPGDRCSKSSEWASGWLFACAAEPRHDLRLRVGIAREGLLVGLERHLGRLVAGLAHRPPLVAVRPGPIRHRRPPE